MCWHVGMCIIYAHVHVSMHLGSDRNHRMHEMYMHYLSCRAEWSKSSVVIAMRPPTALQPQTQSHKPKDSSPRPRGTRVEAIVSLNPQGPKHGPQTLA